MSIHRIIAIILISSILLSGYASANQGTIQKNTSETPETDLPDDEIDGRTTVVEPESFYNIWFISSDKLDKIKSNPGSDAILLKTDPGVQIGIITPEGLYLRADLKNSDFPALNNTGITMEDISRHLIDLAFGRDNQKLTLFKSDKDYKFFFTDEYTDNDTRTVLGFAKIFNDISNIVSIEDEECELSFLPGVYETIPYYYYNITIVSPSIVDEYQDKKQTTDLILKSGTENIIGVVSPDRLVLSHDLSKKEREYYLLKGLLWSMGFHGETTRYPDSFFTKGKMNMNFSQIDIESITLMYGGRLQSGMDLETIEKSLDMVRNQKSKSIA